MDKVEIKLNSNGVRDYLRSADVLAMCEDYARQLAKEASGNYETDGIVGKNRSHARVETADFQTYRKNSSDNLLLQAISKIRGGGNNS